jgi:predicted ATPase
MITLIGPGGIGKTTLALVGDPQFPAFHGDCLLVDLVSLSDPGLVQSMLAGVLGLRLGGDEISRECGRLRHRRKEGASDSR